MLFSNSRWHFAHERDPFWEARCLRFAGGGVSGGEGPLDPFSMNVGAGIDDSDKSPDAFKDVWEEAGKRVLKSQGQTRDAVAHAMQPGHAHGGGGGHGEAGAKDETAEATTNQPMYESVLKLSVDVNAIYAEMIDILKRLRPHMVNEEDKALLKEIEQYIDVQKKYIEGHVKHAQFIANWLDGVTEHPVDFMKVMRESYADEQGGAEKVKAMEEAFGRHPEEMERWDIYDQSLKDERRIVIDDVSQAGDLHGKLENINAIMLKYKELAEAKQQELIDKNPHHHDPLATVHIDTDTHGTTATTHSEEHGEHHGNIMGYLSIRRLFSQAGIELYTPLEVWDAFKSIKESYIKAFNDKRQLRAGVLAKNLIELTKWAPYGTEVSIALEKDVDHKHSAAAKDWEEHLEGEDEKWPHLFAAGHSMLDDMVARYEYDKATGILNYAASRGWLYDIDESATAPTNEKMVLGRNLKSICPRDWSDTQIDNYYEILRGKNMSGANEEIEKNTKKVQGIENTPFFIQQIDAELGRTNLWAAVGIATRAIDRGLKAECSPWVMTTVMRKLRDNKDVKKYASLTFIDKMGKLAAYRSAFTTGMLQNDRPAMLEWIKSGKDIKDAPYVGKIISDLERDIRAACDGEPKPEDLDRAVAIVLSANLLDEKKVKSAGLKSIHLKKGQSITIYDEKYTDYRESDGVNNVNPQYPGIGKEDTDYFFQTTENQYGGELTYEALFSGDGRGGFTHNDRVPDFVGQILKQYDTLVASNRTDAAEKMRSEIGKKLSFTLTKAGLNDSRTGNMYLTTLRQHRKGEYMIKTLIEEGFFDIQSAVDAYWNTRQGATTALAILQQIDKPLSKELEQERKDQNEDTYNRILTAFKNNKAIKRPVNWSGGPKVEGKEEAAAEAGHHD